MDKHAPSLLRILSMAIFVLSCFGLLLFLWLSFGGPVPLKAEGYRFTARFTEAALLAENAEVRMAGLDVGHVRKKRLDKTGGTLAELEIESDFAPIPADSRVLLRQKALLGETYVEITPGKADSPKLDDHGHLKRSNVQAAVEIDEIIRTFDKPTRRAFQSWVRELATAIRGGRGEHLNDAYGNLYPFVASGEDVLRVLDEERPVLERLVRNSGTVFEALTERRGEFRELVVNANNFFGALASRNERLAETIEILPTFLDESKATLARLEDFSRDTRPLVRDLKPVARDLRPTVRDVARLSPDLKRLFRNLDPLIDEAPQNLPRGAKFLRGAIPLFEALHVYLPELNPFLSYVNFNQPQVADFFMNGSSSLNASFPGVPGEGPRHYLKQYTIINSRSTGFQRTRPEYDNGNSYGAPNFLSRKNAAGVVEAFDCKSGSGQERPDPANNVPPCLQQPPSLFDGRQFPKVERGVAPVKTPPRGLEGSKPPGPPAR